MPANAELPYISTQEHLAYWVGSNEQKLQSGIRPLTTPGTSRGSRCKIWVDLPDKWLAFVESTNPASWMAHSEGHDPSPVGNQLAKLLGQVDRLSVSSPKAKRKQCSPFRL